MVILLSFCLLLALDFLSKLDLRLWFDFVDLLRFLLFAQFVIGDAKGH